MTVLLGNTVDNGATNPVVSNLWVFYEFFASADGQSGTLSVTFGPGTLSGNVKAGIGLASDAVVLVDGGPKPVSAGATVTWDLSGLSVTNGTEYRLHFIGDNTFEFKLDSTNALNAFNGTRNDPDYTTAFNGTYVFSATESGGTPVMTLESAAAPGPTITDIDTDEIINPGQSYIITGTNFGATQGTGTVIIDGVAQTVTAWGDTSITCTAVQGNLKYGGKTLTVTTDAATTATSTVELAADSATGGYVDVVDPNTTSESAFAYQVEDASSNPVATGDQFEWCYTGLAGDVTSMTVGADTIPTDLDQEGNVEGRFWDATDSTWGEWYTFTAAVLVVDPPNDNWLFGKGIRPTAANNWSWGKRHPKTGMRVRVYE